MVQGWIRNKLQLRKKLLKFPRTFLPGLVESTDGCCVQAHDDGKRRVEVSLGFTVSSDFDELLEQLDSLVEGHTHEDLRHDPLLDLVTALQQD